MDGHTSRIFACVFNPKSHHELVSGGWDNTVMCWDDRQPYATKQFFGVHMCGEGLDFDKPGKQVRQIFLFLTLTTFPANSYQEIVFFSDSYLLMARERLHSVVGLWFV